MVYVKEGYPEKIDEISIIKKDNKKFAHVISEQGEFEYYIPIVDVPYYAVEVTENDEILDLGRKDALIIEAPNSENRTEYNGLSNIIVPQNIIDEIKQKTGLFN